MEPMLSPPGSPEYDDDQKIAADIAEQLDIKEERQRLKLDLAVIKNTGGDDGEVRESTIKHLTRYAHKGSGLDEGCEKDDIIGEVAHSVARLRDIEERKRGADQSLLTALHEEESITWNETEDGVSRLVSLVYRPKPNSRASETVKVKRFMSLTRCGRKSAVRQLVNCSLDLETALSMHFDNRDNRVASTAPCNSPTSCAPSPGRRKTSPLDAQDGPKKVGEPSGWSKKQRLSEEDEEAATRAARQRFEELISGKGDKTREAGQAKEDIMAKEDAGADKDIKMSSSTEGEDGSDEDSVSVEMTPEINELYDALDGAMDRLTDMKKHGYDESYAGYVDCQEYIEERQRDLEQCLADARREAGLSRLTQDAKYIDRPGKKTDMPPPSKPIPIPVKGANANPVGFIRGGTPIPEAPEAKESITATMENLKKLDKLHDMGYADRALNWDTLIQCDGDINETLDRLSSQSATMPPKPPPTPKISTLEVPQAKWLRELMLLREMGFENDATNSLVLDRCDGDISTAVTMLQVQHEDDPPTKTVTPRVRLRLNKPKTKPSGIDRTGALYTMKAAGFQDDRANLDMLEACDGDVSKAMFLLKRQESEREEAKHVSKKGAIVRNDRQIAGDDEIADSLASSTVYDTDISDTCAEIGSEEDEDRPAVHDYELQGSLLLGQQNAIANSGAGARGRTRRREDSLEALERKDEENFQLAVRRSIEESGVKLTKTSGFGIKIRGKDDAPEPETTLSRSKIMDVGLPENQWTTPKGKRSRPMRSPSPEPLPGTVEYEIAWERYLLDAERAERVKKALAATPKAPSSKKVALAPEIKGEKAAVRVEAVSDPMNTTAEDVAETVLESTEVQGAEAAGRPRDQQENAPESTAVLDVEEAELLPGQQESVPEEEMDTAPDSPAVQDPGDAEAAPSLMKTIPEDEPETPAPESTAIQVAEDAEPSPGPLDTIPEDEPETAALTSIASPDAEIVEPSSQQTAAPEGSMEAGIAEFRKRRLRSLAGLEEDRRDSAHSRKSSSESARRKSEQERRKSSLRNRRKSSEKEKIDEEQQDKEDQKGEKKAGGKEGRRYSLRVKGQTEKLDKKDEEKDGENDGEDML